MNNYLYLSLVPEALIASMLPPDDFGTYLAVGTKKRTRGQAMFIEIDRGFKSDYFTLSDINKRCVPHSNGEPKKTLYLSVYRVMENIPLSVYKNLYLVTDDGRVLEIQKSEYNQEEHDDLHIYQELAPISPFIASTLNPIDFCQFITSKTNPISVPKISFVELILKGLSNDPDSFDIKDLPYRNVDHLKDCLIELQQKKDKVTKTVIRSVNADLFYRTIKNGFFVGDHKNHLYYPFPSRKDLAEKHYAWWRSAQTISLKY
jgi:hypothetical protein